MATAGDGFWSVAGGDGGGTIVLSGGVESADPQIAECGHCMKYLVLRLVKLDKMSKMN